MNTKVSVIIPFVNDEMSFRKRIEYVSTQSFQDYEIILADWGLKGGIDILHQYRRRQKVSTVIFGNESYKTLFDLWNNCIESANSEYVWILEDCDLTCDMGFLQRGVSVMNEHPEASFCCFGKVGRGKELVYRGCEYIEQRLFWGNSLRTENVVFRRSSFDMIENRYANMTYFGNWLLWVELAKIGKVVSYAKNEYRTEEYDILGGKEVREEKIEVYRYMYSAFGWNKKQKKILQGLCYNACDGDERLKSRVVGVFKESRLNCRLAGVYAKLEYLKSRI